MTDGFIGNVVRYASLAMTISRHCGDCFASLAMTMKFAMTDEEEKKLKFLKDYDD